MMVGGSSPMFDFDGIVAGLYEPQFGVLMAGRSVQTRVMRFVKDGGRYVDAAARLFGQGRAERRFSLATKAATHSREVH